ncbi:VOC family protein [Alcaligenaceae bacterium C4P045]|nr:VOC family protein [Alcaligenaceae bacterium C4P045]
MTLPSIQTQDATNDHHVPVLDHVVINVHGALDQAQARYAQLGFQLSARGHHSLGSSNHLAIFGENYLELLGFEPQNEGRRADLWEDPPGLSGLVFKTQDSLGLYTHLQSQNLVVEDPSEFHRPVTLPDGVREARFRTVRLGKSLVRNGRTFFCHHFTPDLVWRDAWREHPNGVTDIVEFVVSSPDPRATVALYEKVFSPDAVTTVSAHEFVLDAGQAKVRFLTPDAAESRYGHVPRTPDGSERYVALALRTTALAKTRALLAANGVAFADQADGSVLVAANEAFQVALRFTEHA